MIKHREYVSWLPCRSGQQSKDCCHACMHPVPCASLQVDAMQAWSRLENERMEHSDRFNACTAL